MRTKSQIAVKLPRIQYQTDDALGQWHREKIKSSLSEAFRDADYATPIWKCESEWDRIKEYGIFVVIWGLLLAGLYGLYFIDHAFK
jgi:hypothetical protein